MSEQKKIFTEAMLNKKMELSNNIQKVKEKLKGLDAIEIRMNDTDIRMHNQLAIDSGWGDGGVIIEDGFIPFAIVTIARTLLNVQLKELKEQFEELE